ncbi:MAG: hypothetical protein ACE5SW_11940 [Nitrososphaeraceae archaeon]
MNQLKIIQNLKDKKSYHPQISKIQILETHISWIILTGYFAYKIKKSVKFGEVLDFSNLKLRKKFCQKEVLLNRPLCGDMYQRVVKIVRKKGVYKVVELEDKGIALEYAVKMIEIPQKFRMDNLLKYKKIDKKIIKRLTNRLVKFHESTPTNEKISKYGHPKCMKKKINENFKTIAQFLPIDPILEYKLNTFVESNLLLFYQRMEKSKIRDIHGDLYLKNIFILDDKFYLYDRIEFNDSLRYADILEDVAHLAMDLDFHKRPDLCNFFIFNYIKETKDYDIRKTIFFMMCYKACVRAKVSLFRANEVLNNKKNRYEKEARMHFDLAKKYTKQF